MRSKSSWYFPWSPVEYKGKLLRGTRVWPCSALLFTYYSHSVGAVARKVRIRLPAKVGISNFFLWFRGLCWCSKYSAEFTIFVLEQGREDPTCQRKWESLTEQTISWITFEKTSKTPWLAYYTEMILLFDIIWPYP